MFLYSLLPLISLLVLGFSIRPSTTFAQVPACGGPAESVTVARDLLVIVFTPEAGPVERADAAKRVGGTLLGPATSGEPGTYYLWVPSGGEEYRLRTAADQLIQMSQVKQVGSRSCPPAPTSRQ